MQKTTKVPFEDVFITNFENNELGGLTERILGQSQEEQNLGSYAGGETE